MVDGAGLVAGRDRVTCVRRRVLARGHRLLLLHHLDDLIERHRPHLGENERAARLVQAPGGALEFLAGLVNADQAGLDLLHQQVGLGRLVLSLIKSREGELHVILRAHSMQNGVND